MEAAEAVQLINARCPELPPDDLARIETALTGEETVPLTTLTVLLAVVERLEQRLIALEEARTYRVM